MRASQCGHLAAVEFLLQTAEVDVHVQNRVGLMYY